MEYRAKLIPPKSIEHWDSNISEHWHFNSLNKRFVSILWDAFHCEELSFNGICLGFISWCSRFLLSSLGQLARPTLPKRMHKLFFVIRGNLFVRTNVFFSLTQHNKLNLILSCKTKIRIFDQLISGSDEDKKIRRFLINCFLYIMLFIEEDMFMPFSQILFYGR